MLPRNHALQSHTTVLQHTAQPRHTVQPRNSVLAVYVCIHDDDDLRNKAISTNYTIGQHCMVSFQTPLKRNRSVKQRSPYQQCSGSGKYAFQILSCGTWRYGHPPLIDDTARVKTETAVSAIKSCGTPPSLPPHPSPVSDVPVTDRLEKIGNRDML